MIFKSHSHAVMLVTSGFILLTLLFAAVSVDAQDPIFRRGDINVDGVVDINDQCLLECMLFGAGTCSQTGATCADILPDACWIAADVNDDGFVSISDGATLFNYINSGGTIPSPFPDCGVDPTDPQAGGDCCFDGPSGCCIGIRGNANGDPDEKVVISDVTYLINYLFGQPNGPAPVCLEEGNANGDPDEKVIISDVTYLINYLFAQPSGPEPPACP